MDLKDITASPTTVYWCREHRSYCNVMGCCEYDGATLFIQLHDLDDSIDEYRVTESCELFTDPVQALAFEHKVGKITETHVLQIDGTAQTEKINIRYSEAEVREKNFSQQLYGDLAFDLDPEIATQICHSVMDMVETGETEAKLKNSKTDLVLTYQTEDESFSYSGCDACNPGLGNTVNNCIATNESDEFYEFHICSTCLYRQEYGNQG